MHASSTARLVLALGVHDHSHALIEVARRLARGYTRAELHVIHVLPRRVEHDGARDEAVLREFGRARVQRACELAARDAGLSAQPHLVFDDDAASAILALAERLDAELIVLGAYDEAPWKRAVFGSVAESVLRRAHCSVMLARPPVAAPSAGTPPS